MSAEKLLALTHLVPFFSCAVSVTLLPARLVGVTLPFAVTLLPSLMAPLLRPVSLSVSLGETTDGGTVKLAALVPVPAGVVTAIVPVLAPTGTVAAIWVADTTEKAAAVPLKWTAVAPVKPVPVRVTTVPTGPEVGVKPVTVGAGAVTVKLAALVPVPPGVVTLIVPLVAPAGTVVVICVALTTVSVVWSVPWKLTLVAPVKCVPVRVTAAPTRPEVGVKLVTVGGGRTSVALMPDVVWPAVTETSSAASRVGLLL